MIEVSKELMYALIPSVIILFSIMCYVIFNLLRKLNTMERYLAGYLEYLDKISRVIEVTDIKLKEVDIKGSFESDDEIGFFFQTVKDLQSILNDFNLRKY